MDPNSTFDKTRAAAYMRQKTTGGSGGGGGNKTGQTIGYIILVVVALYIVNVLLKK